MRFARLLLVFVAVATGIGLLRDSAGLNAVTMPLRLAHLYAQPAEQQIRMPVQGARVKAVADTWQAPRSGGRKHAGQDIFARRGTPVVASADGIIVRLGGGKLGGNAVFVAGRGGRVYYYAHLDRYADGIQTGLSVLRGDVLGYVGTTGNARGTPPHLHFGIYGMTGAENPLPLIDEQSAD